MPKRLHDLMTISQIPTFTFKLDKYRRYSIKNHCVADESGALESSIAGVSSVRCLHII